VGRTVVVITAPGHATLLRSRYLVRQVAEHWGALGVRFVVTTSASHAPAGEMAWLHLDLSDVAAGYRELAARYPVVINGRALDIRKTATATHLVSRDDDWRGPVIVKTNRNYGGWADDWGHAWGPLRHPRLHRLLDRLPARATGRLDPRSYPIHASKASVPGWIWGDSRFVIQRFLAERQDGRYAIRRWFVFGDREFCYMAFGDDPIVMGDDHAEWAESQVPDELRTYRERIGLDYGKVDFGVVDGELVVYDVNPAVSADGPENSPVQAATAAALIPGLQYFLDRV
jgi:hypothetical protein